ncbi:PAAR domain-containing protein [Cupriavidus campinensis]
MFGHKGVVCEGDATTHGGKVLEGDLGFVFDGKPAAGVGHMVWCPKCKGSFPIIEGDPTFTSMGRAMALDGMLTACGARLISSMGGRATVERPIGGAGYADHPGQRAGFAGDGGASDDVYNDCYILRDSATDKPLPNIEYAIRRDGGEPEYGTTDERGRTHLLASLATMDNVTIYVEG